MITDASRMVLPLTHLNHAGEEEIEVKEKKKKIFQLKS